MAEFGGLWCSVATCLIWNRRSRIVSLLIVVDYCLLVFESLDSKSYSVRCVSVVRDGWFGRDRRGQDGRGLNVVVLWLNVVSFGTQGLRTLAVNRLLWIPIFAKVVVVHSLVGFGIVATLSQEFR